MIEGILDRIPPFDDLAERNLCSACMIDPQNIDRVLSIVEPRDFYDSATGTLFGDMVILHEAGKPIDDATVLIGELKAFGHWEEIGGHTALYGMINEGTAHRPHATYYAKTIRKLAELRKQISIGSAIVTKAYDLASDPADIAAAAQSELQSTLTTDDVARQIGDVSRDVLYKLDHPPESERRIFLGIPSYDNNMGPILGGELIILAARPSIGKTALGMQIALHQGDCDRAVLFATVEMQERELTQRLMCGMADVNNVRIRSGQFDWEERERLQMAHEKLESMPFAVWYPKGKKTVGRVRAMALRQQQQHGLDLLVVDYLQKMHATDAKSPREQQVADMAGRLKDLAGDLDIPVLCLCQLSRSAEQSKRPSLSHLRESGAIEQDADTVIFIHREDRLAVDAELIVSKHRFAAGQTFDMKFNGNKQTFEESYGVEEWTVN